jgi:hypothetical protein
VAKLGGIICANFGFERRRGLERCNGAWHASCFVQHAKDSFPVLGVQDLDAALVDESLLEDDDPLRFQEAREGDHLLCPFQCDRCHFANMKKRDAIILNVYDLLVLICIRRAILDSLWARERSTVNSNRLEGVRYLGICASLGLEDEAYPPRGPFPLTDDWGMKGACAILIRSKDRGRNASTIQYDTMRKLRSHLANFSHTCPDGLGPRFMGEEGAAGAISYSPTNSEWFRRFMRGCHRRMGDVWMPDRPVTIHEIKAALKLLEEDWEVFAKDAQGRINAALTASMVIIGFFGALRGEEIVRTDVGAIRKYWNEAMNWKNAPHVPLMLAGRFKRETGEKLFCQPLATVTKSGVDIRLWMFRTMSGLEKFGVTTGPMFRTGSGSKRASTADLDIRLHAVATRVQKRWPNLIPDDIEVTDQYSVYRSLRRGATAEAQNARIPQEVIEANNRWRKHARSRGLTPGMSMMERYTDAKASVPSLIRFSGGM